MKRYIAAFVLSALCIFTIFGIAGCTEKQSNDPPEAFDGDPDGAYFITDDSYKKIDSVGSKSSYWCAIADDQLTVSMGEQTVYDITAEGGASFSGTSVAGNISFWFSGNTLCLDRNGETIKFEEDSSYKKSEEEPASLRAPQDITVNSGGERLDFLTFQWDYQSEYGTIGAAAEIKTPDSQGYEPVKKIERAYMNMFTFQFESSNFKTGENYVRLFHIGGPTITNSHSIVVNKNSDYTTYRVIVDESGSITVTVSQ